MRPGRPAGAGHSGHVPREKLIPQFGREGVEHVRARDLHAHLGAHPDSEYREESAFRESDVPDPLVFLVTQHFPDAAARGGYSPRRIARICMDCWLSIPEHLAPTSHVIQGCMGLVAGYEDGIAGERARERRVQQFDSAAAAELYAVGFAAGRVAPLADADPDLPDAAPAGESGESGESGDDGEGS